MAVKLKKPATAVVFAALTVVFVILLMPRMMQVRQLKERSAALEKELVEIKSQNDLLEKELRLLKDDPVYLEKVARSQFNKAKEGEIVYKVVRETKNSKP